MINKKHRTLKYTSFLLSILILLLAFSQHVDVKANPDSLTELSKKWTTFEIPPEPTVTPPETNAEGTYPIESEPHQEGQTSKAVYLTFDDGPDPKWTPQILNLLKIYNAKATFYMLGRNVATYPELIVELAQAGQSLANHSYNHPSFNDLSHDAISREVGNTNWVTRNALVNHPELESQVVPCVRPPYGDANGGVYNALWGLGYSVSMWDLDTQDWRQPPPASILQQVLGSVETHRVILMHDGGEQRKATVDSLALILHELTIQGYSFEPYCTQNGQVSISP